MQHLHQARTAGSTNRQVTVVAQQLLDRCKGAQATAAAATAVRPASGPQLGSTLQEPSGLVLAARGVQPLQVSSAYAASLVLRGWLKASPRLTQRCSGSSSRGSAGSSSRGLRLHIGRHQQQPAAGPLPSTCSSQALLQRTASLLYPPAQPQQQQAVPQWASRGLQHWCYTASMTTTSGSIITTTSITITASTTSQTSRDRACSNSLSTPVCHQGLAVLALCLQQLLPLQLQQLQLGRVALPLNFLHTRVLPLMAILVVCRRLWQHTARPPRLHGSVSTPV